MKMYVAETNFGLSFIAEDKGISYFNEAATFKNPNILIAHLIVYDYFGQGICTAVYAENKDRPSVAYCLKTALGNRSEKGVFILNHDFSTRITSFDTAAREYKFITRTEKPEDFTPSCFNEEELKQILWNELLQWFHIVYSEGIFFKIPTTRDVVKVLTGGK